MCIVPSCALPCNRCVRGDRTRGRQHTFKTTGAIRKRHSYGAGGRAVFVNGWLSTAREWLDRFDLMLRTQFSFSSPIVAQVIIASAICAGLALTLEPGDTSQMPLLAEYGLWFTHFLTFAAIYLGGVWALQRLGCPAPWHLLRTTTVRESSGSAGLIAVYGAGQVGDLSDNSATGLCLQRDSRYKAAARTSCAEQ